ncbi:MAG: type III pantothenate kinase [Bacteroidia bacterium]|nr:type III pantothenate kinase [Bacteroidia bacterium]MDW8347778.1 type III pantothenate kinase [Bacteroidia bacterium]
MQYLLVDIGNTAIKWALYADENCISQTTTSLHDSLPLSPTSFDLVVVANVGYTDTELKKLLPFKDKPIIFCTLNTEGNLCFQDKIIPLPIQVGYETPHTLGADRLASVLGTYVMYPHQDVIVVDFGTCIKYEILNKKGIYLGGSISPGLNMRYQALHHFTAKLPALSIPDKSPDIIGKNTFQSMNAGVLHGTYYEVKGMIEAYKNALHNKDALVIFTGGDMLYFEGYKNLYTFAVRNLVFTGLRLLAKIGMQHL